MPLSVPEAASRASVDPSYIRAMLASGKLAGEKVGGRWLVDPLSLERQIGLAGQRGRLYSPENAWALLCIASGLAADWVHPSVRSRMRRRLREEGLHGVRLKLTSRGALQHYHVHPGEMKRLAARSDLLRTGISTAGDYRLGLVSGHEFDAYVDERKLPKVIREHALQPANGASGNIVLRSVQPQAWRHIKDLEVAPLAAVVLDLVEDFDPRTLRVGRQRLKQLDKEWGS